MASDIFSCVNQARLLPGIPNKLRWQGSVPHWSRIRNSKDQRIFFVVGLFDLRFGHFWFLHTCLIWHETFLVAWINQGFCLEYLMNYVGRALSHTDPELETQRIKNFVGLFDWGFEHFWFSILAILHTFLIWPQTFLVAKIKWGFFLEYLVNYVGRALSHTDAELGWFDWLGVWALLVQYFGHLAYFSNMAPDIFRCKNQVRLLLGTPGELHWQGSDPHWSRIRLVWLIGGLGTFD
jgi:hypothetical protein